MADRTPSRIDAPFPAAERLQLVLAVGACHVVAAPGAGAAWVEGTYDDPSGALPSTVKQEGGTLRISQDVSVKGTLGLLSSGVPRLTLALGKGRPYALTVQGGANEVTLDLGGVPLTELAVQGGAGRFRADFSAPNPVEMARLDVQAGAVALELAHLANARFAEMRLEGGAASYDLDLGGTLARDATVRLQIGMSAVRISVPAATAARIVPETVLGTVDVGDGFTKREGAWWTEGALRGGTPSISVRANVSLGTLRLAVT